MDTPQSQQANLAEFDRRNAELADWRRIEPRASAQVRNMADYRSLTAVGRADAALYLREQRRPLNPSSAVIAETHRHIFWMATTDAGQFRKPGESSIFGGRHGAEAQRIEVELQRLEAEMGELLEAANTPEAKCAAVAFYHSRFISIHPFMDGNGRTGRAIMESQMIALGMKLDISKMQKPAYISALSSAMDRDDIAPLTEVLGQAGGVEITHRSEVSAPAKVACRPMMNLDDVRPLAQEREMARLRPLPSPRMPTRQPDMGSQ
jgi:fido (protein-threonine AMPylation protein)